ncbi:hypothetical protein KQI38_03610 [Tissierella carlieri]|uniref:Sporulation protein YjcZ n=1 Tax=Tissierella carlieri TaxID=689904 RepID=A0ABT1S5F0_9FIRM|nr:MULTISPECIES: hypothetical protein [Tissierella]MBU5311101.1 hypothetical protein [Tissierella carlieri]MCQ4921694.1 hypothetical protein [Tissierella carlieri]MDU5079972.1 hypothetical protein [Bacillota bacterium]
MGESLGCRRECDNNNFLLFFFIILIIIFCFCDNDFFGGFFGRGRC